MQARDSLEVRAESVFRNTSSRWPAAWTKKLRSGSRKSYQATQCHAGRVWLRQLRIGETGGGQTQCGTDRRELIFGCRQKSFHVNEGKKNNESHKL